MTRIALPQIVSDFPDFQYDEMKQRAENALTQYLQAVTAQNVEILREGNEDLKEQLCSQISASVSEGRREHFTQVKIHQTEIARYRKEAGRCIVTFQSAVESFHYVTDEANVVVRRSCLYSKPCACKRCRRQCNWDYLSKLWGTCHKSRSKVL